MNTQTDSDLVYTRIHQAPPELLFDCMTMPEHLTHFWGPTGTHTPIERITVDLRPGGVFETVMVNDTDGTEYTFRALYEVIDRPHRLVWVEPQGGMTATITFTDLGDGRTEVVTTQRNVPEWIRSPEAQAGFQTSLDRFAAYAAALAAAGEAGR